jgi:Recombination endonuclease VII
LSSNIPGEAMRPRENAVRRCSRTIFEKKRGGHGWKTIKHARNKQFRFCFADFAHNWGGSKLDADLQNGICPGCLNPFDERRRDPCVDHCHVSGRVRGALSAVDNWVISARAAITGNQFMRVCQSSLCWPSARSRCSQQVALRPRSNLKGLALFRCHHRVHETYTAADGQARERLPHREIVDN